MSLSSASRTLQLLIRLLDTRASTEVLAEFGPQKPAIPLVENTQPLPRETPERQGVPSRQIAAFLEALDRDPTLNMHSVTVLRRGSVLAEAAFGPQDLKLPKLSFSACKSLTSLAVGLCMDDGLLSPDDKLVDLFPDEAGAINRRLLKDLTVADVLSMETGVLFNEAASMTAVDWTRQYFSSPGLKEKFQYNSLNTYILAVLVTRLTGKSLTDFLTERLFQPMGIDGFYWEKSPEGVEKGGWGLYMRPEDMAKLGILVQNGGLWNGRQLISRDYIEEATTAHAQAPESYGDFNYGWQIWVGRTDNTFLFNGMMGQNVLCFRDSGVILMSHAGNDEGFQQSSYFKLAARYFGGTFPDTLPRDLTGERALKETLERLADHTGPLADKEDFARFAGRRFTTCDPHAPSVGLLPLVLQAADNSYTRGLEAVSIGGTRQLPELIYEEHDQFHHIFVGTRSPQRQTLTFHGNVYRTAVQGVFTRDEDGNPVFRIQIDFLETPCTRILKLFLKPTGPILRQEERPGLPMTTALLDEAVQSPALKPVVSAALGRADPDYLHWRLEGIFRPEVALEAD